jgi:hypothetical protein
MVIEQLSQPAPPVAVRVLVATIGLRLAFRIVAMVAAIVTTIEPGVVPIVVPMLRGTLCQRRCDEYCQHEKGTHPVIQLPAGSPADLASISRGSPVALRRHLSAGLL